MRVVTSYINPDIDGVSSMFAYAEYLRHNGFSAGYYFSGVAKNEVNIVLEEYGIKLESVSLVDSLDDVVLVDTNSLSNLPSGIAIEQIKEIIDHHKMNDWLINCDGIVIQIELVGAAATLIAEKFYFDGIDISDEAAILLYNGIVSNTMNLQIKMTTDRDRKMANWLKSRCSRITDEKTRSIFVKKSCVIDRLRSEMEVEIKDAFMSISWCMGQLEIADVDLFLGKYESNVRSVLGTVRVENDVSYISVNCMDIINGYTVIVAFDDETADLISQCLNVQFKDLKARLDSLVSRKEIVAVIRQKYGR